MNTGASNPVVLEDVQAKLVKPTVPVIGRVVSNELCMNGKSASFVKHTTFDVSGTGQLPVGRCACPELRCHTESR